MLVSMKSPVTGKINTMRLDITHNQLNEWNKGGLIQNVMPNLTPDEREFLISDCTPNDWDSLFGDDA